MTAGVSVAPSGVDTQVPQMGATTSDLGGLAQQLGQMRPPKVFGSIGDAVLDQADQAVEGAAQALSASDDVAGQFVSDTAAASAGYQEADEQISASLGGVQVASADAPAMAGSSPGGSSGAGSAPPALGGAADDWSGGGASGDWGSPARLPQELTGKSPAEALDYLRGHPEVAARLADNPPYQAPAGGRDAVRAAWEGMSPQQRWETAATSPNVGNLAGVPFENRDQANRVAIAAELGREQSRLTGYQTEQAQMNERFGGWNGEPLPIDSPLERNIAESTQRIDQYKQVLQSPAQVLNFDPSGDGTMVRLFGGIDANTRNVGVVVPGTTASMTHPYSDSVASSITAADPTHSTAMVSWVGGDFPNTVGFNAPMSGYERELGPQLAGFSHDLRQEIDHSAAAGNNVQVTALGHSYGGAVVGTSEADGADFNRVVHVESAGMGYGVYRPSDLHNANADVQRYSMLAPLDPIYVSQGNLLSPHGADPTTFPGITRLATGNDANGQPMWGVSAHGAVLRAGSDSWRQLYNVVTGGTVRVLPTVSRWESPLYRDYRWYMGR